MPESRDLARIHSGHGAPRRARPKLHSSYVPSVGGCTVTISPQVVSKCPTPGRPAYNPYGFFIFAEDP
jgi:hypothetical protein